MEQKFCQSCGMPLVEGNIGTNSDGSKSEDYCGYCYKGGAFLQDFNMSQMIEFCTQFTDQINKETGWGLTPQQAKAQMQCKEVTLASVNADGFPRPVPLDKIHSLGCNEVWVVTAADSEKVADFRLNPKAGLSYSFYGDSVALRGTVEIITDDETRKRMWQEYFINYFPGGPAGPNYVLIRFIGNEATIWINREFAHISI